MGKSVARTPSLRRHKPSSLAVVTLNGKDHYLGPWPADQRKPPPGAVEGYDHLIAEWLANGRRLPAEVAGVPALTVNDLILAFYRWAEKHYRREDGTNTSELNDCKLSLRPLRQLYGTLAAAEFSPLKLKAVRQHMIENDLSRGVINQRVRRVVRMFKWSVSEELVPPSVLHGLQSVRGLQRGRTEARETEPVGPVCDEVVDATLPHVLPPVRAMIQFQRLTGARPGEVCAMRGCDLDTTGAVWLYRPFSHKTKHHGKARVVALGPRAQAIVKPFLKLDTQAYLFSPAEALATKRAEMRAARKTRVQPSQQHRRKQRQLRPPGPRYVPSSYSSAVRRACKKHGIEPWHPHQLRHSHATEVRRQFGLEAAQVALGHSQAAVTEIYAERDLALAVKVAAQIG
jgi:integrase